jgi:DNA primase
VNLTLLEQLVEEDFGYRKSGRRWGRSEQHSSLVVDGEKQVFYFNNKGLFGSTLDYLTKVRGMPLSQAKEFLLSHREYSDSYIHHYNEGKEVVTYPPLADSFHEVGKLKRDYFYRRGVTDEFIDRFNLGFFSGWYTIPIYDDGMLRNIQLRQDDPKRISKYYKGMGANLFNVDVLKFNKEVFYVEGPVDAIVMLQYDGVPVISSDSGGAFDPKWIIKFTGIKKIHLVFDNDPAGVIEAKRISKQLGVNRCKIYTFSDFETKGYDPVDYYRDGLRNLVDHVTTNEKYSMEV